MSKHTLGFLSLAVVIAGCAGGSSSPGTGTGGSSASGGTQGQGGTGTGGSTGTGGASPNGGTTGTGGNTATGGAIGTGGATATGGATGTGGSTGTGGTVATGGTTGTGGNAATGGATGTGGAGGKATGGTTGTGGNAGATGTGGAGGGSSSACPSDATFCSGFETAGLPTGATYMVNAGPGDWSRDFAIDTSQHHAGASSLLVKNQNATGSSGSGYRMLAVPVPTGAFWVRFWVESDAEMGGTHPHNAFAGTSPTATPNDPLDSFAEDVGISFHTLDSDVTWPTGYGRIPSSGNTNPYTLPAMTWACVEISYDLANRHQQLYIGGTLLIDATNYPPSASYSGAFGMFKFGFNSFNGPARQMWYDDVTVAPTRVGGCQ